MNEQFEDSSTFSRGCEGVPRRGDGAVLTNPGSEFPNPATVMTQLIGETGGTAAAGAFGCHSGGIPLDRSSSFTDALELQIKPAHGVPIVRRKS